MKIILNFNFDVFYMFRIRGLIFKKMVVYILMVRYVLHASVYEVLQGEQCSVFELTVPCLHRIHNRLPEHEPSVRNMQKTP